MRGWAPQRARQTGPTGCWQKLCSAVQTRALSGPGGESRAAEVKPPPPPTAHIFLSAYIFLSCLEPLFPLRLSLHIPPPSLGVMFQE